MSAAVEHAKALAKVLFEHYFSDHWGVTATPYGAAWYTNGWSAKADALRSRLEAEGIGVVASGTYDDGYTTVLITDRDDSDQSCDELADLWREVFMADIRADEVAS